MRVSVRIDASAGEARRLLGLPDLLPLVELANGVHERALAAGLQASLQRPGQDGSPPVTARGARQKLWRAAHGPRG